MRSRIVCSFLACALVGWTVPAAAVTLVLEPVVSGLSAPVGLEHAGDGSGRLFVVEQNGRILIVDNGVLLPTPFLELAVATVGSEQGLLGLAFHPSYQTNGFFFVHYSAPGSGDTVVSRFSVSADPDVADPASEQTVLTVSQPQANHNGGQIAFGPDGMLYIGLGDGGGGGDPSDEGQDLLSLLGALLRIDVDRDDFPADPDRNYGIPVGNPFVGDPLALDEIWAYGLRNPWRFSFDRTTGDLFIGDVGQGAAEEIDLVPAGESGHNLGWDVLEGSLCHENDPGGDGACADFLAGDSTLPIIEYLHTDITGPCCSVTGGFRSRGPDPTLTGRYFYAEYVGGIIWAATEGPSGWTSEQLADTGYLLSSFGEDERGELYLLARITGALFRITTAELIFADHFETGDPSGWSSAVAAEHAPRLEAGRHHR